MVLTRAQKQKREMGNETPSRDFGTSHPKRRDPRSRTRGRYQAQKTGLHDSEKTSKLSKRNARKRSHVGEREGPGTGRSPLKKTEKQEERDSQPLKEGLKSVKINRAPVLTLWSAIVAEREGYSFEEGLTFGRWISGTLAQTKGRSLGIYKETEHSKEEVERRKRKDEALGVQRIPCFGMKIPTIELKDVNPPGHYAVSSGKAIQPESVLSYLQRAFHGTDKLQATKNAMRKLAYSIQKDKIGSNAYNLYEEFRPPWHGWGQPSTLDLNLIHRMADRGAQET